MKRKTEKITNLLNAADRFVRQMTDNMFFASPSFFLCFSAQKKFKFL